MIDNTRIDPEIDGQLKPCPFCGGTAFMWYTNDNYPSPYVVCNSCTAMQKIHRFKTVDEAIEAWNRRVYEK